MLLEFTLVRKGLSALWSSIRSNHCVLYQNDWATAKKITNSIADYTNKLGVSKEQAYELYKTHGTCLKGLLVEGRIDQATADYMGMLGTAINGMALKEQLEQLGVPARVLSALNLSAVAETFIRGRALRHLEKGRVVIFVAGTGNPFFTTDTAASLRAAEIGADAVLKATKVDGIYDKDPNQHADAVKFDRLTFRQAIEQQLKIMDLSAFSMCMDRGIPIVVFNMKQPGNIAAVVVLRCLKIF